MADHIKIYAVKPKVQYVGNGITTEYPYQFPIFDETNMEVYFGSTLIEEGYVVNGAGETAGGTIVFDEPPAEGVIITLVRNIPIERVTDFQEGGAFRPKNLNDEFDRQTAFLQQVEEALDRSLKVSVTSSADPSAIIPLVEKLYDDLPNIDTVAQNIEVVKDVSQNMEVVLSIPELTVEAQGASTEAQQYSQSAQNSSTQAENYATAANESKISAEASAQEAQQYADLNKRIIGEIIQVACSSTHIPNGCLPCNGQEYAKEQFADLWNNYLSKGKLNTCTYEEYANDITLYGQCAKFGVDTETNKFKVPTIANKILNITKDIPSKGNGMALGIATGSTTSGFEYGGLRVGDGQYSGVLSASNGNYGKMVGSANAGSSPASGMVAGITTDSTKSGIISDLSNNTLEVRFFVVVANGQINQEQMDWSEWASSLNLRMDTNASNATSTAKETINGWGMPDLSRQTALTNNAIYQAEKNGYVVMYAQPGWSGNAQITVGFNSALSDGLNMFVTGGGYYDSESERGGGTVPVAKGCYYRAGGVGFQWAKFIPCKGE